MTTSISAIGSHMSDNDPKALEHHKEKVRMAYLAWNTFGKVGKDADADRWSLTKQ